MVALEKNACLVANDFFGLGWSSLVNMLDLDIVCGEFVFGVSHVTDDVSHVMDDVSHVMYDSWYCLTANFTNVKSFSKFH